jgi:RNA polymerase sigma-70 factor (ECF subfamily)
VTAADARTQSGSGPSDAALVVAARAGEPWAQEALFRRYARRVNGLAHRLMPIDADADELVQDAFLYAFQNIDRLDNPQAFASWLMSIVVRTANKRIRRQRLMERLGLRRSKPVDMEQLVARSAPPDAAAEARALYEAVEKLPAEERLVLLLHRVEGMTIAEVSKACGKSPATVKRRLAAAQQQLDAKWRRGLDD